MITPFNPYWWTPVQQPISRIDIGGIFKVNTNGVSLSDDSVDYGINPIVYKSLPSECLILLFIHADIPSGGESLPVTIAVPNNVSTVGDDTTKINIVDSLGENVTGNNIKGNTQRLVYINKNTGVIRFVEFTNV